MKYCLCVCAKTSVCTKKMQKSPYSQASFPLIKGDKGGFVFKRGACLYITNQKPSEAFKTSEGSQMNFNAKLNYEASSCVQKYSIVFSADVLS